MYGLAIGLMAGGHPPPADYGIYCWLLALLAAIASVGAGVAGAVTQGRIAISSLAGSGAKSVMSCG